MIIKELFFQRTIGFLANSEFDVEKVINMDSDNALVQDEMKKCLSHKDFLIALEIYNYESVVYSFFYPMLNRKNEIFEQRKRNILAVEKVVSFGKTKLLEKNFKFNKNNLIVTTKVDINTQKDLGASKNFLDTQSYVYYVKPSLLSGETVNEIRLDQRKIDYLLFDLYRYNGSFSGTELLLALQEKFHNSSKDQVVAILEDKLLQYLIIFDALKFEEV